MNHPILGELRHNEGARGNARATVEYESRKVEVRIFHDDEPFERAVQLAADVVMRLKELDQSAKRRIVMDLREKYNSGWNEYDEVQEDGSLKAVFNPELSESEFEEKFSLDAINVTGSEGVDLFYDDSGLFWGHSIVVTSTAGTDFTNASASLFG
jgi:hypothetical protein